MTWIGTGRVLQFIRQVIEGDTGSLSRTSSTGGDQYGARRSSSSVRPAEGSVNRYSSTLRQPSRRGTGYSSRQSARGGEADVTNSRSRDGEDVKGGFSGSRTDGRGRSDSHTTLIADRAVSNQGGGLGRRSHKFDDAPRGRGSGGESVSSKGVAADRSRSQRWRSSGAVAVQSDRRGFRANDSAISRGRRPGVDAYAGKGKAAGVGGSDRRHTLGSRSEPSRFERGGWGGRGGNVESDSGTTSSKKHKLRRPSLAYSRPGRR